MSSVFLPAPLLKKAQENARKYPQIAKMRDEIVAQAQAWVTLSDETLWEMMFGATIKRSWMVWSNGYCPACKRGVPMYNWEMNPFQFAWKTRCPHCKELFPKNDFEKFYRSGQDEHGVFDPKRADRSLLFNAEHPDPKDPLHHFGVDDGEGYVAEGHRWRFIGAYLIYGQWKQAIHGGVLRLSAAYAVTGDRRYAHKAGVLLDRVADLYPTHDFGKQGVMYEGAPRSGYISTWHDACIETRQMALAYDMVREAIGQDAELAKFLKEKAQRFRLTAPKETPADILRNIEQGILVDPQNNLDRIYCNYPQTEMTVAILKTVQNWQENREAVAQIFEEVVQNSASADGVTGEKGLSGYAVFATSNIANVLALYSRAEPNFLRDLLQKHPRLKRMFRFHIDTWHDRRFYPRIGDTGTFATPENIYMGVAFSQNPGVGASMHAFLMSLYEETGDPSYVQALYHANGDRTEGLPYDLFAVSPETFQKKTRAVIERHGVIPKTDSLDLKEWHLAMLRSGTGEQSRMLWLDYDAGGYHSHADGMNLGLFAFGLDLLPDFGYPPVQFGGWESDRSVWYTMTAAHNTVVVDGANQSNPESRKTPRAGYKGLPAGKSALWAQGETLRAVRAEGKEMYPRLDRYERTVAMIEVSPESFYVLDVFQVQGGKDHAKFLHSGFGTLSSTGLALEPAPDYGHKTQMRSFRADPAPPMGWQAEWKIEDRLKIRHGEAPVFLRHTDLTEGAQAALAEAWIAPGGYGKEDGEWIPRLMTRRTSEAAGLKSTFVGVLEPYRTRPSLKKIERLSPEGGSSSDVAASLALTDGRRDVWLLRDSALGAKRSLKIRDLSLETDAEMLLARSEANGEPKRLVLSGGSRVTWGDWEFRLKRATPCLEIVLETGAARVIAGDASVIATATYRGKPIRAVPSGRKSKP